jgi:hypothetical protein
MKTLLPHKADEHPRAPIATGDNHDANETPASVTLSSPVKEHCHPAKAKRQTGIFHDRFKRPSAMRHHPFRGNFVTAIGHHMPAAYGGGERDRTDDLLLAKQALSQLSYTP